MSYKLKPNTNLEAILAWQDRQPEFQKQSELDKHFGRRMIVEEFQDELMEFDKCGIIAPLCQDCKHSGDLFIVNGYIHMHCQHPDEKISGEPGWGSLRHCADPDHPCFEAIDNAREESE